MVSVAVVVLGDIGRSPRMQYHCSSLAREFDSVSVVGYRGERCVPTVEGNPRIKAFHVAQPFRSAPRRLFLLYAPLKVLIQMLSLLWTLLVAIPRPSHILVQNPPSIPALLVVWVAARIRGARAVIDWHNFGYTILALSLGARHPFVVLSRMYERLLASRFDGHLCVTEAMRAWLRKHWGVRATVLYDRAPEFFRRLDVEEVHALVLRLGDELGPCAQRLGIDVDDTHACESAASGTAAGAVGAGPATRRLRNRRRSRSHSRSQSEDPASSTADPRPAARARTLLTEALPGGGVRLRADRPALLVSSTSWTPDEDFGILLGALRRLDQWAASERGAPKVLCIVTGKGPQRAAYEAQMQAMALSHVHVGTMWLEAGDYPRLLGAADLGVCLHTSSSGLDLPMKVVDMFGAGLPVCAVRFQCLHELVRDGENGHVFDTEEQLADQLTHLLRGFPRDTRALERLRGGVAAFQRLRWEDNWRARALPLFRVGSE